MDQRTFYCLGIWICLNREVPRTFGAASFGRKAGKQPLAQCQELKKGGKPQNRFSLPLNNKLEAAVLDG